MPQDETLRWGVIGAGCSGIQITEALAWKNVRVTQFVRRPQWIHIRENPEASWWERLKLRLPGQYRKKQRALWDFIIEGDAWRLKPGPQRAAMEREYRTYLDVIRDPELKKKLTPSYHLGCTRIPKSDQNYYHRGPAPECDDREPQDRAHRARGRRAGGRHGGGARRARLRHRLRHPCLYAADGGDRA